MKDILPLKIFHKNAREFDFETLEKRVGIYPQKSDIPCLLHFLHIWVCGGEYIPVEYDI